MDAPRSTPVMLATLELAVPLWVEMVKGWTFERRQARASACAQLLSERADVLQFGGKPGEAGAVFNALAEGLAIGALQPGGVRFHGLHFEATAGAAP